MSRVSVVIPAYNGAAFIKKAIDSALAQTWTDREIVVIDDGSIDNTAEIVATYGSSVRYVRQQNAGTSVARNRGIDEAQGEYVAFLDQDDWWAPNKLERQVSALDSNAAVGVVYCDFTTHRVDGSVVESYLRSRPQASGWILDQLMESNMILPSAVLARRAALLDVGGFDPGIRYCEDFDLWIRLAVRWQFLVIPEVLAYRIEGDHNFGRDKINSNINKLKSAAKILGYSHLDKLQRRRAHCLVARVHWSLAWESFHSGDYDDARKHLVQCVKNDSRSLRALRAWVYLGTTMLPNALIRQLVALKRRFLPARASS